MGGSGDDAATDPETPPHNGALMEDLERLRRDLAQTALVNMMHLLYDVQAEEDARKLLKD